MVIINVVNDQVKGEVYLVDDAMLGQLDILEDHPTYYRCITIIITINYRFHGLVP